jgi:hypothetical protein
MTEAMLPATKFTPLQQELLSLDSMNLSEEELQDIKKLLSQYFWDRMQKKITLASEQMGYTQDDFDAWLNDPNQ